MSLTRRDTIARLFGLAVAAALPLRPRVPARATKPFAHPDPRPGITAERVIPADKLAGQKAGVRDAYEAARRSPEIFDGLYCVCDCKDSMGHRSLLACFESMQPTGCAGCQEQAHLVAKMVKEGKSLADIRQEFDRKWGS
jgi:hypothetical protein